MKGLNQKLRALAFPVILVLLTFMGGCNTVRPLSTGRTLYGHSATECIVVVPEAYTFRPGLVTHTLPAGTYNPMWEGKKGVYFQSPTQLQLGDLLGPTSLHDGGIVLNDVSTDVYEYMEFGTENIYHYKLPSDFKFSIKRKP